MVDHMTSIIPLSAGIVLLALGLAFDNIAVYSLAVLPIMYGLFIHSNTVKVIRKS